MTPFAHRTGRPYLVIARVGDNSLHREWLAPDGARNFDLLLNYYGDVPNTYAHEGDMYLESKGTKWPQLYDIIQQYGAEIEKYEAVWFPDDDIRTNADNINRMFQLFSQHGLMLAQPALTKNAFFQVTAEHLDYELRYTQFVEIMVPIFSREALKLCWPSFNKNITGWFLEFVWPKLLGYPRKKIAVLDSVSVVHTRPPGNGDLYADIQKQLGIPIWDNNEARILDEYGVPGLPPEMITFYDGIKRWHPPVPAAKRAARKSKRKRNIRPSLQPKARRNKVRRKRHAVRHNRQKRPVPRSAAARPVGKKSSRRRPDRALPH